MQSIGRLCPLVALLALGLPDKAKATELRNQLTSAEAQNIAPVNDPFDNYERIQWCLDQYNLAKLADGEFLISNFLTLNDGDSITATNLTWPIIKLNNPQDAVLKVLGNGCTVSLLQLDYNNRYYSASSPVQSVIQVTGNYNAINNNHIRGGISPQDYCIPSEIALKTMTGVYFFGNSIGNVCEANQIYHNTYGVIFNSSSANSSTANVVRNSQIFYNQSDGITLVGYGEVDGNTIHHNGYDCMNGFIGNPTVPIPGAGIYAIYNSDGALIKNNTIYDNCGNGIDIVKSARFIIQNNLSYDPGARSFPNCSPRYQNITYSGGFPMVFADINNFTIENNVCENNRSTNRVGDGVYLDPFTNHFFSDIGAAGFSDLPSGDNQVIAFVLAETYNQAYHTVSNVIRNNKFRSSVASPSVGLGYFASRGTGFGQVGHVGDGYWGGDSTNYFTLNDPFGSDLGSKRCGGNWYAANGSDLNTDDYQHLPPTSDWAGNDFASLYAVACDVVNSTIPSGATIGTSTITASVANATTSIIVNVTTSCSAPWKLYSDAACTSEITNQMMNLSVGANTSYLKVTAQDGVTTKVYTLIVTRGVFSVEVENLPTTVSSGDSHAKITDAFCSGGFGDKLIANAKNDYVQYTVNVAQAGTYTVYVKVKKALAQGKFQLAIDGVNQGSLQDLYSTSTSYVEINLGSITFTTSGNKSFRFKVPSKNALSARYDLLIDAIKLQ